MRIVVVGAGILGLSVAYNLAARGAQVVVFEKKYPGSGLSGRAIGGVHSQWENEHDIKLAKKSREILSRLPDRLNFNIPFRRDGYLMLATTEDDFKLLKKNATLQRSFSIETTPLSAEEISARYAFLDKSGLVGGTFSKKDGVVYPFSLVYGYWKALKEHGGKLVRPMAAEKLQADGRVIKAAESDGRMFEADAFVVAAGQGTCEILRSVGLDVVTKLLKHEMLATEPLRFFLEPMIQVYPNGIRLNQSLRGEIICDLERPSGQTGEDTNTTLEFLEDSASGLTRLIPALADVKVLRPWAGLVETSPDSEPLFGRLGYENLWVAFSDSGKGIMFAPAVGELMSEAILRGQLAPELDAYSPDRFLT